MISKESTSGEIQSLSLIRYVVTFLIGSGGTGAAIGLVGKEGFQYYGLITLGICMFVAAILIIAFIWLESGIFQKSRSNGLSSLNGLYVDSLQTIGEFLVRGTPDDSRILKALAKDLKNRAEIQKKGEMDLLNEFRNGVKDIADCWEELAAGNITEEAKPIQED